MAEERRVITEITIFEDRREIWGLLKQVKDNLQFWIGDWARFGEKKGYYTDSKVYDELEEITGLKRQRIKQYKSVAERTESFRRLNDNELAFSHFEEVASLDPAKQKQFLDKASDENLSVRELRREIRLDNISNRQPELIEGKYKIIYVDPPWSYNGKQDIDSLGGANKHYPTI
ncbi:MAG: hypothetical protein IIC75_08190 [Bacteroidetes bacterium]|nr:hypothetical protein [Bacteroidota bacterium]